jgi:hypothetical protein
MLVNAPFMLCTLFATAAGLWQYPFKKWLTKEQNFTLQGGRKVKVGCCQLLIPVTVIFICGDYDKWLT